MAKNPIWTKLKRLRNGKTPRILDLFAGSGGLSLGFNAAGCELLGGLEIDPLAAKSHAVNFFKHLPEDKLRQHELPRDIIETCPSAFVKESAPAYNPENAVEFVIGGPPCQAFSIVGRAKLRQVNGHRHAFKNDARADLVDHFLEYVSVLRPLGVLIENVPEILRFGGRNVADEVAAKLYDMGYYARYTILNSVHYGVPAPSSRTDWAGSISRAMTMARSRSPASCSSR